MVSEAQSPRRRWLHEPLLHFVLLGALVFVAYETWTDGRSGARISPDSAPINMLRGDWKARVGVAPTPEEEERLKRQWLEEEVLYRRAMELGLGESDTVVRRRLVQRMRFLIEDTTPVPEPEDLQLQVWVDAHPEKYAEPSTVSLEQVFFSRAKRGDHLVIDADAAARKLASSADANVEGDPFPRGSALERQTPESLSRAFGAAFTREIEDIPVGEWHGPIESSYGLHVVRLDGRSEARPAALEHVRERARADWLYAERQRLNHDAVQALVDRYVEEERGSQ